jgi:iron complex transport system substrate-binding protein
MLRGCLLAVVVLLVACEQSAIPDSKDGQQKVQRIVSLAPHVTELIFAAGAGDRLVGVVEYSDFPPAAKDIRSVGDAFRIDYESLEVLQPDLVIGWASGNPPEMIARIRELGFRVVLVDAHSLDEIAGQLEVIGALTATAGQADKRAAEIRQQLAELRSAHAGGQKSTVFWQISAEPYYTITGQHVLNEVIEMCGGKNIFADLDGMAASVTLESILVREPDVIIAAVHPVNDSWQASWLRWTQLEAISRRQLYSVDSDLVSRPGPRLVAGAAEVCKALAQAAKN